MDAFSHTCRQGTMGGGGVLPQQQRPRDADQQPLVAALRRSQAARIRLQGLRQRVPTLQ
jgi:hypothetical protein